RQPSGRNGRKRDRDRRQQPKGRDWGKQVSVNADAARRGGVGKEPKVVTESILPAERIDSNPGPALPDLAQRIHAGYAEIEAAGRCFLERVRDVGRLLLAAKAQLLHGQWLPWIEAHCPFAERTARLYMAVADRWEDVEANRQRVADMSLRGVVQLLAREPAE